MYIYTIRTATKKTRCQGSRAYGTLYEKSPFDSLVRKIAARGRFLTVQAHIFDELILLHTMTEVQLQHSDSEGETSLPDVDLEFARSCALMDAICATHLPTLFAQSLPIFDNTPFGENETGNRGACESTLEDLNRKLVGDRKKLHNTHESLNSLKQWIETDPLSEEVTKDIVDVCTDISISVTNVSKKYYEDIEPYIIRRPLRMTEGLGASAMKAHEQHLALQKVCIYLILLRFV
ncbi:hypothetical protein DFJ77DRAFT_192112 [Powellomyces hirtus]|nr:hypothetical protein DFJ77DRAFT_192112 [Powellomyces hirtus]